MWYANRLHQQVTNKKEAAQYIEKIGQDQGLLFKGLQLL